MNTGDGVEVFQKFERGDDCCWSPTIGAFEVHGAILARYTALRAAPRALAIRHGRGWHAHAAVDGSTTPVTPAGGALVDLLDPADGCAGVRDGQIGRSGPRWAGSESRSGIRPREAEAPRPGGRFNGSRRASSSTTRRSAPSPVTARSTSATPRLAAVPSATRSPTWPTLQAAASTCTFADLERGDERSIYWHPSTGAWEVYGLIRGRWAELGWQTGFLGYPKGPEAPWSGRPGGRAQTFRAVRSFTTRATTPTPAR